MIKIKNVSMKFNLGIEKNSSLKKLFIKAFTFKKKQKNSFWALKDINIEIKKGEVVGLIGSNGAGKSTLLKVIAGVMKPTEGISICEGKICPMIELGAGFDGELTARENIYLNGAVMGYDKAFIDTKFDEIVDFSELIEFLDVPVKNFSSGMMARLAFSIATVVDPEVLIVDEILSVGDASFQTKSGAKMQNMIQGGTTVLFVSHSLEQVKKLCTRVIWLDTGRIIKDGSVEEVCDAYQEQQETMSSSIRSIETPPARDLMLDTFLSGYEKGGYKIFRNADNKMQIYGNDLTFCADNDQYLHYGENILCKKMYDIKTDGDIVVIDIGSHIGFSVLFFARETNVKKIYGYEPFADTFRQLEENLNINEKFKDKIQIFNYGLGADEKQVEINYNKDAPGGMCTIKNRYPDVGNKEKVQIKKASTEITKIIKKHSEKIIVKINCVGAEEEIIKDFDKNKIYEQIDVILLVGILDKFDSIIKILKNNKFTVFCEELAPKEVGIIRALKNK